MSQQQVAAVEQKFKQFRAQLTAPQFNNPDFLVARAKEFLEEDAVLAFRILQRVRNIAPNHAELALLLPEYRKAAQQANPEFMRSSSNTAVLRRLTIKKLLQRGPAKLQQQWDLLPSL